VAIEYLWEVTRCPGDSSAGVKSPAGVVYRSSFHEYLYQESAPTFTADRPGEYRIKLSARLLFADPLNPKFPRETSHTFTLEAEGEPASSGGCNLAPGRGELSLLLLLLAPLVRMRHRSGSTAL
jgi:hypothetical protein